ncbi:hypothetical protein CYMTET_47213, partial [Cymbomonas tetramitiformis]
LSEEFQEEYVNHRCLVSNWDAKGRITQFVNVPAGGGKTYIGIEMTFVLLGGRCITELLRNLHVWYTLIKTDGSDGMLSERQHVCLKEIRLCRMSVVSADSSLLEMWSSALQNRSDDTTEFSVDVFVVKSEVTLQSFRELFANYLIGSTEAVENGRALIVVCDRSFLPNLLKSLDGKPFVSLVLDDPRPIQGECLVPICRRVHVLSADSTTFVTGLSELGARNPYSAILGRSVQACEKERDQVQKSLLFSEKPLKKRDVEQQPDVLVGNLAKFCLNMNTDYWLDWLLKDTRAHIPEKIVKFPLMDCSGNKVGEDFFSEGRRFLHNVVSAYDPSDERLGQSPRIAEMRLVENDAQLGQQARTDFMRQFVSSKILTEKTVKDTSQYSLGLRSDCLTAPFVEEMPEGPRPNEKRHRKRDKTWRLVAWMTKEMHAANFLKPSDVLTHSKRGLDRGQIDEAMKIRLEEIQKIAERRPNDHLMCARCGWGFRRDDEFCGFAFATYACLVCPNCGNVDQAPPNIFGKGAIGDVLGCMAKCVDDALPGDSADQILASFSERLKRDDHFEFASFKSLFMLLAALVTEKPKLTRFLLYVQDRNRPSILMLLTLLGKLRHIDHRSYVEQKVDDPYLRTLLCTSLEEGPKAKGKGRKGAKLVKQTRASETSAHENLRWFNDESGGGARSSAVKLLILSSDMNPHHQEVYGIDAQSADCSVFVNFPTNRTQAVARGLRMSNEPKKRHYIIYM